MDDAGSSPVTGTRESYNAYMRQYLRERYEKRSAHFISELGGVCASCGSSDDLQFDHIDKTTKRFEVRALLYKRRTGDPDLLSEIAKCQLLCRLCHDKKSAEESSVGHGEGLSGKKNCKCGPCRTRKAEYMSSRSYNQNRCRKKNCNCEKKHYPA